VVTGRGEGTFRAHVWHTKGKRIVKKKKCDQGQSQALNSGAKGVHGGNSWFFGGKGGVKEVKETSQPAQTGPKVELSGIIAGGTGEERG